MEKFEMIKGNHKDTETEKLFKLLDIYIKAYIRETDGYDYEKAEKPKNINKIVTYGVNEILLSFDNDSTLDDLEVAFNFAYHVNCFIGMLTPRELIDLFPIDKTYDGKKWGTKDYYYTKDFMDSLPQDKPIGKDKVLEVLWEYMNKKLLKYLFKYTNILDELAIAHGEKSATQKLFEDAGIDTFTMHEDSNGKKYIVDNTGKTQRLDTHKSNFKVVKGGKHNE